MFQVVAIILLSSAVGWGDLPERPPVLDFKKKVDYIAWWNAQRSAGESEKDNAFELYKQLTPGPEGKGGLPRPSQAASDAILKIRPYTLWTRAEYPALAEYLDRCQPQLKIMQEAAKRRRAWDIDERTDASPLDWGRTYLSQMRQARNLLVLQCWMKDGKANSKFLDLTQLLLRHADHHHQVGSLLDGMMGYLARVKAYESTLAAFGQGLIPITKAQQAYQLISKVDPGAYDLVTALDGEWCGQLRLLQYLVVDGKVDKARVAEFREASWHLKIEDLDFDPVAARDTIDQHFKGLRELVNVRPLAERTNLANTFIEEDAHGYQRNGFTKYFKLLTMGTHFKWSLSGECRKRGSMLSLALLAHKAKHEAWPSSLQAIDKKLGLDDVEKFLIDPHSDEPFRYRLRSDEPLLYSMAADGKDDGGRHDRRWGEDDAGGDYVFWPVQPKPSLNESIE